MTLSEITERVLNVVQDDSFEDSIPFYVNRCLDLITERFNLEALDSSDTLTLLPTANLVPLPDNYMKGLYWASDSTGRLIGDPNYYLDFKRFLRMNPGRTEDGSLDDVCANGRNLHYAKRCSETVDIRFFEKPTYLISYADEPGCVPAHMHDVLFVNYCAWRIFDLIEDGIEDPKTNTGVYQKMFFSFLPDLQMYEVQTEEPVFIQDEWSL